MRRLFAALLLSASAFTPALAQDVPPELVAQQQQLQSLLNDAIVALRANNKAQECSLRSQALAILNTNIQGFEAAFPANTGAICRPHCREAWPIAAPRASEPRPTAAASLSVLPTAELSISRLGPEAAMRPAAIASSSCR